MTDLDTQPIAEADDRYSLSFEVPAEAPYLRGHFPDNPLVPAAQILAWLQAAVARTDPRLRQRGRVERAKFLAPVRPGQRVTLEWQAAGESWLVNARADDTPAVRAELHPDVS